MLEASKYLWDNVSICCRSGYIYVNGSIANATVAASGLATVYVLGLENAARVNLGGVSQAVIGSTEGQTLHAFRGNCTLRCNMIDGSSLALERRDDNLWSCNGHQHRLQQQRELQCPGKL